MVKKEACFLDKDKRDEDKSTKKSKKCKFVNTFLDYVVDDDEVRSDQSESLQKTWQPTYLALLSHTSL